MANPQNVVVLDEMITSMASPRELVQSRRQCSMDDLDAIDAMSFLSVKHYVSFNRSFSGVQRAARLVPSISAVEYR